MKIIAPSVELISEKDPYKKIELAGRTYCLIIQIHIYQGREGVLLSFFLYRE